MILEAALKINFDCFVPSAKIEESDKGTFKFSNKIKYKRRKFEFHALTDFLKIPRLSFGSQEERTLARYDFYNRWGFLTGSNDYTKASENEATFDSWHIKICKLNEMRIQGNLKDADDIEFTTPKFLNWTVHQYEASSLALPVFNPTNLSSALYLSWFFGSKELAGMRTCKRFFEFGPKSGCQVVFTPSRKDKTYCCDACKKASHEKLNPRNRRSKK
jgi:hypothetical protein